MALEKETAYLLYHTAAFTLEALNKQTGVLEKLKLTHDFNARKNLENMKILNNFTVIFIIMQPSFSDI